MSRIYILQSFDQGWIIEKLMEDICAELSRRGYDCAIGARDGYDGQDIVYHARGYFVDPVPEARINSVFLTHVDDKLKIRELQDVTRAVDSIVCMSRYDEKQFRHWTGLDNIHGIDLPHRGGTVRRPRIAVFSARYSDGRKNEQWIYDLCAELSEEERRGFILSFLGSGWEDFGKRLAGLGVSFEIYNYDRKLPGEYEALKDKLSKCDLLIYPGFEGGGMCAYDAIFANIDSFLAYDGYHLGLGEADHLFSDYDGFKALMQGYIGKVLAKDAVMQSRNVSSYVDRLLEVWGETDPTEPPALDIAVREAPVSALTPRRVAGYWVRKAKRRFL